MNSQELVCECGNDEFKIRIIEKQNIENPPVTCDTFAFYCTKCNHGKVIRVKSDSHVSFPEWRK